MKCYPTPQRKDWFITSRKLTICPHCGAKEVRKAVFGFPSREDSYNPNIIYVHKVRLRAGKPLNPL